MLLAKASTFYLSIYFVKLCSEFPDKTTSSGSSIRLGIEIEDEKFELYLELMGPTY